jgi:hypothetical protein
MSLYTIAIHRPTVLASDDFRQQYTQSHALNTLVTRKGQSMDESDLFIPVRPLPE